MQCRVASSLPGLYPIDANIEPPAPNGDNQICHQTAKCPVGDKIAPVESNGFQNVLTPGASASPQDLLGL